MSCNSQNTKNQREKLENKYNMEKMEIKKKFDVAVFNKQNNAGRYEFIDLNGVEVTQWVDDDFPSGKVNVYIEERNYPNSPYKQTCAYDNNGNLVQSVKTFYGFLCETELNFDINGNIISEKNHDILYGFSIMELIVKMEQEYEIDMLDKANNYIARYQENKFLNIPVYEIYHVINDVSTTYKNAYLIDGNSGETLFIIKCPLWEDGMEETVSIVEEYFNSLEKKQ